MISAVFIVRNERERIVEAVRDVRPYVDELLVIDQSSDDGTFDLLIGEQQAGTVDRIIVDLELGTSEPSRPRAIRAATGPWILFLDADEVLSLECKEKLPELLAAPVDFYHLRRVTWVGEQIMEDMLHHRLFRKGFGFAPTYENLGEYAHSCMTPCNDAREATPDWIAIEHRKSWDEQAIDNERSDRLMAMRPPADAPVEDLQTQPVTSS